MPFGAKTGRNSPSSSEFIFGPSRWLRGLIRPEPGRALAYLDWQQQEFAVGAVLSGDQAMLEAYQAGDPYLAFGKQTGDIPPEGTKATHPRERALFKETVLAIGYGQGAEALARKLEEPPCVAKRLLRLHQQTYPRFWRWTQAAISTAMLHGSIHTVFGWVLRVGTQVNPRSLLNYPCQANAAEMLRLACCLATERGIQVNCPVHDALVVEGPEGAIHEVVGRAQAAMAEASRIVLGGLELRTDVEIVKHPDRYMDDRGVRMWDVVMEILEERELEKEVEVLANPPF